MLNPTPRFPSFSEFIPIPGVFPWISSPVWVSGRICCRVWSQPTGIFWELSWDLCAPQGAPAAPALGPCRDSSIPRFRWEIAAWNFFLSSQPSRRGREEGNKERNERQSFSRDTKTFGSTPWINPFSLESPAAGQAPIPTGKFRISGGGEERRAPIFPWNCGGWKSPPRSNPTIPRAPHPPGLGILGCGIAPVSRVDISGGDFSAPSIPRWEKPMEKAQT